MADWIADAEVIQPEHGQLLLQLLLEPEPAMYSTDPQRNQCLISVVQNYEQEKKTQNAGLSHQWTVSNQYGEELTSGRSEVEGSRPRERADLTELRIFSPTFEKSIPPPWDSKSGSKKKTREVSNPPSLKSPLNRNGLPRTPPKGNRVGCILARSSEIGLHSQTGSRFEP